MKASCSKFLLLVIAFAFFSASAYAANPPGACTVEDLFKDITATENCEIRKTEANNPANQAAKTCGKYTADPVNQPGAGSGDPFVSIKVFSAIICRIVQITRDIAGTTWCGISNAIADPLRLLITLFIVCMAILFTIGVLPPSGPQLMMLLMKIALIWGLATDGQLAIQFGYNFFMTVATDGISIALTKSSEGGPAVTPGTIINSLDEIFTSVFFSNAPLEQSKEAMSVFAAYAAMSSAVPLGVTLGTFLMLTVFYAFFVFLKAVMSYLFAITGITFLCAIMPLFLALALFRNTSGMFWGWLGALVSLTIQPIILFAFLILVQSHIRDALDDLSCIVQERISADPSGGQYNSNGTVISLLDPNKYHLTTGPCPAGVLDPSDPNCQYVDPYRQWDNSMEFLNDTTIPIVSAIILLVMTNAFLGHIPELSQALSNGMMGHAAPAIGGSAYSGGSYYVRNSLFDSGDRIMRAFNTTAGRGDDYNIALLRNPLIPPRNPHDEKPTYDKDKLEVDYSAFLTQSTNDARNQMFDLGLNNFSTQYRAGKDLFHDRNRTANQAPPIDGSGN